MRLKDLFLLRRHLSSSCNEEQVAALHRCLASGKMLRIAIEQQWITEGQAYFFAVAHRLLARPPTGPPPGPGGEENETVD